ncbi:BNR-4 repeat-containing protein [Methylopila sp. M107]|uniref:BNR-4 repeat-containing protein n=1 Tax=Methylopila sp. M107 TaxID=1101190 RepID=UPI00037A7097|nr:BNR-4 repeat-containing protein [Methylopila sp. M107]
MATSPIIAKFDSVYRDHETPGVPASGRREPDKREIRAIGPVIQSQIELIGAVAITAEAKTYTTYALANADKANRPANSLLIVYADPDTAKNGIYVNAGGGLVLSGLSLGGEAAAQIAALSNALDDLEAALDAEEASRGSADTALDGLISTERDRINAIRAITITGGGLATAGGDLTAPRTITVPKASEADVNAAADDTKAVTPFSLAYMWAVLNGKVPITRVLTAVGPLLKGGGGLNTDRNFEVTPATAADLANTAAAVQVLDRAMTPASAGTILSRVAVSLLSSVSATTAYIRGNPLRPTAQAALSNAVYAISRVATEDGLVLRFSGYALVSGTAYLKRTRQVSGNLAQVGPDYPVVVPAGEFDLDIKSLEMPLLTGEHITAFAPGVLCAKAATTGPGFYRSDFNSGNVLSFPIGTEITNTRLEFGFEIGALPAQGQIAVALRNDPALALVASSAMRQQVIGTPNTPISAPVLSAEEYAIGVPAVESGWITALEFYALRPGTLWLKVRDFSTPTWSQAGVAYPVRVSAAGLWRFTMADFGAIRILAGQYPAFFSPGMVGRTTGVVGVPLYNAPAGSNNVETFTDATPDSSTRPEIRITIGSLADGRALANAAATLPRVAEVVTAASRVQRIGATTTPVAAPMLAENGVYFVGPPLAATGPLLNLYVHALYGGLLIIKLGTRSLVGGDTVWTQVGPDYPVWVKEGPQVLTIRDFGEIIGNAGEYVGWYGHGMIARTAGSGIAGPGLYSSGTTGNVRQFIDNTVDTSARPEIAFDFGKMTFTARRIDTLEARARNLTSALESALVAANVKTPAVALAKYEGFWIDADDPSTLRTDIEGLIPVTADGDAVRYIVDKSGYGFDAKVFGDGFRPIYKTGGQNGRSYLLTTGVEALEFLRRDLFRNASKVSFLIALSHANLNFTGSRAVVYGSLETTPSISRAVIGQHATGSPWNYTWSGVAARRSAADAATFVYSPREDDEFRITIRRYDIDFANGKMRAFMNGESGIDSVANMISSGKTIDADAMILGLLGRDVTPPVRHAGRLYAMVCLIDADETSLNDSQAYLAQKYAVSARPAAHYNPGGLLPGTWTWFNDPRAIALSSTRFLVSSVSPCGSNLTAEYNFATGVITHFVVQKLLQQDDHNNAAKVVRADGRILQCYAGHAVGVFYAAISTNVGDGTSWQPSVDISSQIAPAGITATFSYANLFMLDAEGNRIYLEFRAGEEGSGQAARYLSWSDNGGVNWTQGKQILVPHRPYTKWRKTSPSRADMITTTGHPNDVADNSVFHMYMEGGNFYKSDGTLIGPISGGPYDQKTALTKVFDATGLDDEAWVWDIVKDPASAMRVAMIATFEDPVAVNHHYRQARYIGGTWVLRYVASGGGNIYPVPTTERQYSGGAVHDPENIDIVYCSRQVDGAGVIDLDNGVHQLFKCVTTDGGVNWTKTQLTFGTEACFRPYIPEGGRRLFFSRGRYTSYVNFYCFIDSIAIS